MKTKCESGEPGDRRASSIVCFPAAEFEMPIWHFKIWPSQSRGEDPQNLLGQLQLAARQIGERIVFLRGERGLLDADLATLSGVTTGALNRVVKRHHERFPADFMLQFTDDEANSLSGQTGILKTGGFQTACGAAPLLAVPCYLVTIGRHLRSVDRD